MLYFDRIDVSEGVNFKKRVNQKSSSITSKECDICRYWYFLNKGFKFQTNLCNRCHELSMMSVNHCDNDILNIKSANYRWF